MGSYDDNLRFLSLCVLFNVNNEIRDKAAKIIKEKDCIIECLCSNGLPDNSFLHYPDVYEESWHMLCINDTPKIKEYVKENGIKVIIIHTGLIRTKQKKRCIWGNGLLKLQH